MIWIVALCSFYELKNQKNQYQTITKCKLFLIAWPLGRTWIIGFLPGLFWRQGFFLINVINNKKAIVSTHVHNHGKPFHSTTSVPARLYPPSYTQSSHIRRTERLHQNAVCCLQLCTQYKLTHEPDWKAKHWIWAALSAVEFWIQTVRIGGDTFTKTVCGCFMLCNTPNSYIGNGNSQVNSTVLLSLSSYIPLICFELPPPHMLSLLKRFL